METPKPIVIFIVSVNSVTSTRRWTEKRRSMRSGLRQTLTVTGKQSMKMPQQNVDCVGHVQKRMGKALRELKKKGGKLEDGKPIGGRGNRLTDSAIDKLQLYYGRAIRANTVKLSSDAATTKKCLEGMKKAIQAVLHHSVISNDDSVRHQYCPDGEESWCSFKKTGKMIADSPHHLDPAFLNFLQRLIFVEEMSAWYSQNQNESLNSLVWLRAPKHKQRGTELAVILAVMQFNQGSSGKHSLMKKLNIAPGIFGKEGSAKKDTMRVKKAKTAVAAEVKST